MGQNSQDGRLKNTEKNRQKKYPQLEKNRERELVEATQHGDFEAFSELYDHYYDKLLGYAVRRTTNLDAAKDIVGNAFLKALDKISQFKWGEYGISPWLYRICSNEIADYFKGASHYHFAGEGAMLDFVPNTSASSESQQHRLEEEIAADFDYRIVTASLKQLKANYQEVIQLKYFEDKSTREIGAIMELEESSVRSLLSRALKKLEQVMAADGHELNFTYQVE